MLGPSSGSRPIIFFGHVDALVADLEGRIPLLKTQFGGPPLGEIAASLDKPLFEFFIEFPIGWDAFLTAQINDLEAVSRKLRSR